MDDQELIKKQKDELSNLANEYLERMLKAEAAAADFPNYKLYKFWFWASMVLGIAFGALLLLFPDAVWHWIIRAAYSF